jgi:hypothetical protein
MLLKPGCRPTVATGTSRSRSLPVFKCLRYTDRRRGRHQTHAAIAPVGPPSRAYGGSISRTHFYVKPPPFIRSASTPLIQPSVDLVGIPRAVVPRCRRGRRPAPPHRQLVSARHIATRKIGDGPVELLDALADVVLVDHQGRHLQKCPGECANCAWLRLRRTRARSQMHTTELASGLTRSGSSWS